MNPPAPPPSTPTRIASALGRSFSRNRDVALFMAGAIFGALAVLLGRLT
jgi:hypothetical protein